MARRPTRLLVATRHNPLPENDGAGAYLFDLLSYLTAHDFEIEVAWLHADGAIVRNGHWRIPRHFSEIARLRIIGGRAIGNRIIFPRTRWLPVKARLLHQAKKTLQFAGLDRLIPKRPERPASSTPTDGALTVDHWSALPTSEERAFFRQRVAAFRPEAVLVNYCWLAPLLDGLGHLPTAILTNDVASQRLTPKPGLDPDPATPSGEAAFLRRARHILAISEDDAAVFRARLPGHSIILTPKAATPKPLGVPTDPSRVLFVGGINAFNQEGLQWFLDRVWPRVRAANSTAALHVCGGICSSVSGAPDGVILRGRVPDLTTEYAAAAVVVVPLLNGTGVKIKLVEAASYGKAIVTTPVGLQGLSFLRDSVLEAGDEHNFATAVLQLLRDLSLQSRLGHAALESVAARLAPDRAYAPACTALTSS